MQPVLYGAITGVLLCLTFGTVFFSLLQNSVENGYRAGIKITLGVVVCDAIFVICSLFGTSFLPKINNFENYVTVVGVVFLIAMGLANLFKQTPRLAYPKTRFGDFMYYFSTGFLLNGLNPINFVSWVTLAAYTKNSLHYTFAEQTSFMVASLFGILVAESSLAIFAHRLKRFFTPRVVTIFNRTTGMVFLFVAAQLVYTRLYQPLLSWVHW
ncbi:hypothetical protein GCM10023189_11320 [Nibrella saemangeumensis]|uniref:Threonine/homoserine/homoserine lactone efflux protein n=1 Tax=Nibrella saemangeumensis TaxID=1084526 RepID=A0ABP8MJ84_9BACT